MSSTSQHSPEVGWTSTDPGGGPVDAHQHFWDRARASYSWLGPELGAIDRDFQPVDLEPELRAYGVRRTVLVQAANSFEETDLMLEWAEQVDWIAAVVGWIPLDRPREAREALGGYRRYPKFKGVRHLIHTEPDVDWLVRPEVLDSLALLADEGLPFDVVAVFPDHLKHVPVIAERLPGLRLVIDHLAKPPIRERGWEPWATQLAAAAEHPNVSAKLSGLNTAADPRRWGARELQPYVDHALKCFGSRRLMFGSDWPVCLMAGDYKRVWEVANQNLAGLAPNERFEVLGGTATRVYSL